MVNKIILRSLILYSLCTPCCNASDNEEELKDLSRSLQGLSISRESVGPITLEELEAANPMTGQLHELSSHIKALKDNEEKLPLKTIINTLNICAWASEMIREQIFNTRRAYFEYLTVTNHDNLYHCILAQKKYADETREDLHLIGTIYLKYPQLFKYAMDNFNDISDTDRSTDLSVWINRNWDDMNAWVQRKILKRYREMYISTYASYHQFILKYLPGRTFLNAIKN
jgi:hypothetical protein